MLKKWLIVFFVFFLGTAGLVQVDQSCRETTGCGGILCPSIQKNASGDLVVFFFGMRGEIDL